MKKYELVCILDPQIGEAQFEETITKYEGRLQEHGAEVVNIDRWGLRKLAYTSVNFRRRQQGYYVLFQIVGDAGLLPILEEEIKLDENVMRHLFIGVDGEFLRVPQLAADNIFLEDPRGPRRGRPGRDGDRDRDRDRGRPPRSEQGDEVRPRVAAEDSADEDAQPETAEAEA